MSFHLTAEGIRIKDKHVLIGNLRNDGGELVESEIDLNEHLGNDNGQFQWEGNNFADTADNVHFAIEGDGEVPVLRADLSNLEGATASVDVNLAERIVNSDGAFVFQ